MEVHDLGSWREFRPLVETIRESYGVWEWGGGRRGINTVMFRGHANPDWPLSTTLERATSREFTVQRYLLTATRCLHELESFTGKSWAVSTWPELEREILEEQSDSHPHLPHYDLLVYLRHHGFPSPLLDWTASPYIAAYFAYADRTETDRVAVYAYVETPEGGKGWSGYPPLIHLMGPYVSTDARHFAQKAWYTITTQCEQGSDKHVFRPHSSVFELGHTKQDVLVKITMPASDRLTALKELEDYNINRFTLFQTEDALVQTLALREFDLRDA